MQPRTSHVALVLGAAAILVILDLLVNGGAGMLAAVAGGLALGLVGASALRAVRGRGPTD